MRTIIAGSRGCTDMDHLLRAVQHCGWCPTVVLSGTARGADRLGEEWAEKNNVPIERYPANWEGQGKKAGIIRNAYMADRAEALIALWDGASRGTENMIQIAKHRGLRVYIAIVGED